MVPRSDAEQPAVPKLTLGQRVLTALPDLRRPGPGRTNGTGHDRARRPARADDAHDTRDSVLETEDLEDATDDAPEGEAAEGEATPGEVPGDERRSPSARPSARSADRRAPSPTDRSRPHRDVPSPELVQRLKRLDDRERRIALIAAPVGAVITLLLMVVALHDNPPLHHKNHADPGLVVLFGVGAVVFAAGAMAAAWSRRRSLTVFALAFSGLGGNIDTVIPLWFIAGWLLFRTHSIQKELTLRGEGPRARAQQARDEGRGPGGATSASSARRAATASARKRGTPAPAGPGASKRYTPPKPTRPKLPKA